MRLRKENILIKQNIENWEEAIEYASKPLLKNKVINRNYISKMIENVKIMGPYIVLSNDIAMPHARPEDGAAKSEISLLKLKDRVSFGGDKHVNVIITLACADDDTHIKTLSFVSKILSDDTKYKKLISSYDIDEIYNIFNESEDVL